MKNQKGFGALEVVVVVTVLAVLIIAGLSMLKDRGSKGEATRPTGSSSQVVG